MNKVANFFKKNSIFIYCLILAFLALLITSKNSFLYPLNDWVDANAFFTVGKSMFNGIVPYKDIFEQKGLILYLIYGIGYLISPKSFHGVFIIEVLFFAIFLYYVHKIICLFLKNKYSYIFLPILTVLITTSVSFVHGGSCEEFCLPFFAISLYYYLKHFKDKEITYKQLFINGLIAGIILMIKYTFLGFWFAFMMFIFFDFIRKKSIKRAFLSCVWFLLGMIIPIILSLIYLGINGGIKDFIDAYFTINMTAYNDEVITIGDRFNKVFKGVFSSLLDNGYLIYFGVLLLPWYLSKLKMGNYEKFSFIGIFIIFSLGLFWGLHFYRYYLLPLLIFLIVACLGIGSCLKKHIDKIISFKYSKIIYFIIFVGTICFCYVGANYKEMILMDKKEMFQFKYAEYINKFDNPTLLNMGYLDAGLYTTTGIVPNTKFFEVQNIPYDKFPDNLDDMKYNVVNKNVMFVLYYTKRDIESVKNKVPYLFENYSLVFDDVYLFEKEEYNAYLFYVNN